MIAHLTAEQLIQIYEVSGRALDIERLRAVARELYPSIIEPDGRAPIFLLDKSFKGFLVDGEYKRAKYTITSRLVNGVGIMDDGTPISYDK